MLSLQGMARPFAQSIRGRHSTIPGVACISLVCHSLSLPTQMRVVYLPLMMAYFGTPPVITQPSNYHPFHLSRHSMSASAALCKVHFFLSLFWGRIDSVFLFAFYLLPFVMICLIDGAGSNYSKFIFHSSDKIDIPQSPAPPNKQVINVKTV